MQQEWHLGRNESKPFSPPPRCNLGRSDSAGFDEVALNDFDVGPSLIETLPWSLVWIFGAKVVAQWGQASIEGASIVYPHAQFDTDELALRRGRLLRIPIPIQK